jgi:hypothetical protein
MEALLVRFERDERAFIRKQSRRQKKSEAQIVRDSIKLKMGHEG